MKRRREMEKGITEIRSAIEELTLIVKLKSVAAVQVINDHDHRGDDEEEEEEDDDAAFVHNIPIRPFLSICNLILQVLDKIGPTMAVLRQDIHQNIQRLEESMDESEASKCWNIEDIIKKEVRQGIQRKRDSCSKALVWLTRSLDFTVALLQRLSMEDNNSGVGKSMEHAVEESYEISLKPWHGWISSAAVKVALKLVPDKNTFISHLSAKGHTDDQDVKVEMKIVVSLLHPFLEQVHSILKFYNLDRLKAT